MPDLHASSPIYYHPYTLRFRAGKSANAASPIGEARGALLRIGDGFACLQPWPTLGDPTLAKCLSDLQGKRRWPLVRRALRCAEYDAHARQHEESLFEEMEIPPSHFTCAGLDRQAIDWAVELGHETIKLKCGRDLNAEALFLREASAALPKLRWRLDFNEVPKREEVRGFILALPEPVRDQIDFLEDPCPFHADSWETLKRETGADLALDREAAPNGSTSKSAAYLVLKPALDEPWLLAEAASRQGQRVIVTSYMDHPLGQAFAAWEAGRLALQFPNHVGTCGLQTHHLFEPNAFTEALGDPGPTFQPTGWTGLGFDELLDELPWKELPA
ncbi:MAG: hypothetical protein Q7Q71_08375 [Verrucomicrobiota bacterium JB023]|nr:hypothetical protein [Verrucomicrobiota bacterium JB023]